VLGAAVIRHEFSAAVLIISDDPATGKLWSGHLIDGRVHSMFVATGDEALTVAARLQPAVALLAVDQGAVDLAAAVKRASAGARIIVVQAAVGDVCVPSGPDSPIDAVMAADALPDAVVQRVHAAVQQYAQDLDRRDRLNELLLLEELGKLHTTDAPVDVALAAVSRRLVDLAGVDFAALRWFGADHAVTDVSADADSTGAHGDGRATPDAQLLLAAMHLTDPANVISADADELPADVQEAAGRLGLKTVMRLPLTINDLPGGLLVVGRRTAASYTRRQAARLQHVAGLVAAMIERTTFLDDGRRQTERLKRLQEIVREVTTATDAEALVRRVAEGAGAVLAADAVHIWLVRRASAEQPFRAARVGASPRSLDALAGRVFASGRAESATGRRARGGVHAQLAIPLASDGRMLGVLALSSSRRGGHGDDDARIATILADNLAVALERIHADTVDRPAGQGRGASADTTPMDLQVESLVHDMVQPVTAALAMLEALVADEALSPTGQLLADRMHRALRRVGQTSEAGNHDAPAGPGPLFGTDVRHVLSAAVELVEDQLATLGITLVRTYAPNLPPLAGDASALERVFVNLLVNARDAMTGRTGHVTISAEGCSGRDGDSIVVRFHDEGHGIADSVRARLFEPNVTTKAPHARHGLGLTICREIVERQGGNIDVEPVDGQGACFRVELPALRLPRPDAAS